MTGVGEVAEVDKGRVDVREVDTGLPRVSHTVHTRRLDDEGDVGTVIEDGPLFPVKVLAEPPTIVGGKNHDRVVRVSAVIEGVENAADAVVDEACARKVGLGDLSSFFGIENCVMSPKRGVLVSCQRDLASGRWHALHVVGPGRRQPQLVRVIHVEIAARSDQWKVRSVESGG
jgi:hypothetical protein